MVELLNFVCSFSALFESEKLRYIPIFDQIKDFKGTVVNRTSLHGGSLEVTRTVPLI